MHGSKRGSQVFYRPLEAAIYWAGLATYREGILSAASTPRQLPDHFNCPRWDELRLCVERIYDAIVSGELPYGRDGITLNDPQLWDSPNLTVRHLDLKRWMQDHYPDQRPRFLFSRRERNIHPAITLATGHAMLIERQNLKVQLDHYCRELSRIREQHEELKNQHNSILGSNPEPMTDRAESTYLHIIGSMLELILGQSPSGIPYSCFKTQEAIVTALVAHHGGIMGITARTLNGKFSSARKKLRSASAQ